MIKPIRGWLDSTGTLHTTREDASKAEFRQLLTAHFGRRRKPLTIEDMVSSMFVIDKMIGQAVKEDTRADIS